MKKDLHILCAENLEVGENPIWDYQNSALLFLDIRQKCIYRKHPGQRVFEKRFLPQMIGCMGLCENGELLLGLEDGVYRMNHADDLHLAHQKTQIKGARFNDGKIGPDGAFYLGTADDQQAGAFYRLRNGHLEELFDGCGCSNGIDWTKDTKTMYYIDSPRQAVEMFDFDILTGTLANRRTFMDIPKEWGLPDGMTLDAEDHLWVALWGGHRIIRIDKNTRKIVGDIQIPCPKVSSCAFGGEDLSELYITTAAKSDISAYPCAGNVFSVTPGISGKRINYYKG